MEKNNKVIQFRKDFKKKTPATKNPKRGFALYNEGLYFYNQDKNELALKKFKAAEAQGYESSEMFGSMGWLYNHFNESENAKIYAQKAIDIDEEFGFPYGVMGKAYQRENQPDKALEYLLLAEKYGFSDEVMFQDMAILFNNKNNFLKAMEYTNKAIEIANNKTFPTYLKGYIYYLNNNQQKALIYYKKAETMGYSDFSLYYEMSYCYSCLDEHEKGLEYANKSIFLDKKYPMGYYRKGFAYFQAGDDEHALEPWLQAEKLGCQESDMFARISYLYSQKSQNEKSIEYADKAIKADKTSPEGYIAKANICAFHLNDYKSAVKLFKKAYNLYNDNADSYFYMNYITTLSYLNKHKKSLELATEALDKFPENYNIISIKISALQFNKKYEEAKILTEKLIELDPTNPWTIYTKALTYYNCKVKDRNYDKIITLLSSLEEGEIDDFGGRNAVLAFAYCEKKDFNKSFEYFIKFAKQENSIEFYTKNKNELKKYFKKLKNKVPKDKRLKELIKIFKDIDS